MPSHGALGARLRDAVVRDARAVLRPGRATDLERSSASSLADAAVFPVRSIVKSRSAFAALACVRDGLANLAGMGGNAATGMAVKSYRGVKRFRRRLFERMGSDRYSRPARFAMDVKLRRYLPQRGFFVEAGANDGYRQSNTYWLERFGGWRGLLVEPVPELARLCAKERPGSRVVNCALGAPGGPESLTIHVGGLVSKTEATPDWDAPDSDFGEPYTKTRYVTVPARTLSSLLDEVSAPPIDFLSLDVEGYEPQVLAGLETRHLPRFMLIEVHIAAIEPTGYRPIAELSPKDVLFERIDSAAQAAPQ